MTTYLDIRNVTLGSEVHPVRLVQLRTNHVIQVRDLVILAHERRCDERQCNVDARIKPMRTCQTELGVCLDGCHHTTEHRSWYDVHFVQENKAPFSGCEEFHHLLRLVRAVVGVRHHGIRRDDYAAVACELQSSG